jgi:SM-20-related protein
VKNETDLFSRLGLLIVADFLDEQTCAELRAAMQSARKVPALVRSDPEERGVIDEQIRKTKVADVPEWVSQAVEERLTALTPTVEAHFGETLGRLKTPQFLRYGEGDFFKAHADRRDTDGYVQDRRVSALVFLNGETTAEEYDGSDRGYVGGSLVFYGLMGEDPPRFGMPLRGRPGLLVAFDAGTFHEVTPVERGERFSVVSWYVR